MYSVGVGDVLEHVRQIVRQDHSVPVEEGAVTGLAHPGEWETEELFSTI